MQAAPEWCRARSYPIPPCKVKNLLHDCKLMRPHPIPNPLQHLNLRNSTPQPQSNPHHVLSSQPTPLQISYIIQGYNEQGLYNKKRTESADSCCGIVPVTALFPPNCLCTQVTNAEFQFAVQKTILNHISKARGTQPSQVQEY